MIITTSLKSVRYLWKGGLWSGMTNAGLQLTLKNPENFDIAESSGSFVGGFVGAGLASFLDWQPFSDDPVEKRLDFSRSKGQSYTQIGTNFAISFATSRIGNLKNVHGPAKSFVEKVAIGVFSETLGNVGSHAVINGPIRGY